MITIKWFSRIIITFWCLALPLSAQWDTDPAPVFDSEPSSTTTSGSGSEEDPAPRTGIYAGVVEGNAAADFTISDYLGRAPLIPGQFVAGWGGSDLQNAAFSFEAINFNWFGSFTGGTTAPNELRVGAGNGQFGGGLILPLARTTSEVNDDLDRIQKVSNHGIGFFGALQLLENQGVFGEVGYFVAPKNPEIAFSGADSSFQSNRIHVILGHAIDAEEEGDHALVSTLLANLDTYESDIAGQEQHITENQFQVDVNYGYWLAEGDDYSVFLGESNTFNFNSQKDHNDTTENATSSAWGLRLRPNLAFQKQLGNGFEGQMGAGVNVIYGSSETSSTLQTVNGDVSLGLRWAKENFAIEGSLNETLVQSGPDFIGGTGPGMFGQVGVVLGF